MFKIFLIVAAQKNNRSLKRKTIGSKAELELSFRNEVFDTTKRIDAIKNERQGYLDLKIKKSWKK